MRGEVFKYQNRQHKIDREDSSSRPYELSKVSSYTPGNWKNYIPNEISLSSEKRSHRLPSTHSYRNAEPNYEAIQEDSRVKSILTIRREEEKKRQQSAMRKVRELQQRILPMVKGSRQEEQGAWIGWQSRIQQKLVRLEGQVQNMKKEMQLELEKRMVELENRWTYKFDSLQRSLGDKS